MISAFQNCSKFEDPTYFGKPCYPKENIINVKYFCFRYGAIKSKLGHPNNYTCVVSTYRVRLKIQNWFCISPEKHTLQMNFDSIFQVKLVGLITFQNQCKLSDVLQQKTGEQHILHKKEVLDDVLNAASVNNS